MVVDVDKKQKKKTEWKPEGKKRNVTKLGDETYRQLFECGAKEVMSDNNHDLRGSFKEGVLRACDVVCGYM